MNWIKRVFIDRDGAPDWVAIGFTCAALILFAFIMFGACEKKEPKPDQTQVISNTIVDVVKSISDAEARKAEAKARALEAEKGK